MDFSLRAKALRTPKQARFFEAEEEQAKVRKQGLSRTEFWQTQVKCRADVLEYYELYYPEFPEVLVEALADKIDTLRKQCVEDAELRKKHAPELWSSEHGHKNEMVQADESDEEDDAEHQLIHKMGDLIYTKASTKVRVRQEHGDEEKKSK